MWHFEFSVNVSHVIVQLVDRLFSERSNFPHGFTFYSGLKILNMVWGCI